MIMAMEREKYLKGKVTYSNIFEKVCISNLPKYTTLVTKLVNNSHSHHTVTFFFTLKLKI